jgi:ADP-ribose pyrophosphatase YjhB (NUDIX family)
MLPASHLELFESPDGAAVRIAREQLGLDEYRPGAPTIVSETYHRSTAGTRDPHWDLHFIYRSTVERRPAGSEELWERLEFKDPQQLAPTELARNHADILAFAGRPVRGPPSH